MSDHDWPSIHRRLRSDAWYHLGDDLPYTLAKSLMQGSVVIMRDVEVRTRNTRYDASGKRWCSIHLRRKDT